MVQKLEARGPVVEYYQPHLELRFLCAHFRRGLVAQGRSKGVKQLSPESVPVLVMNTSQAYRQYVVVLKLKNTFLEDGGVGKGMLSV